MFRGKKYKESAKQIDRGTLYDPKEGLELVCKTASAKFDETVELHVKLGVDSRHADQQVRGAIVLPNGTGKTRKVLVFAKDAKVDEARTTVDDEERVAKMQEADAMVAADCPVIPVMFYTHTIVGSDRIKHLYVDPQKHAELGTAELA